jgi:uncharacterized protein YneF (UPF0154 family)
MDAGGIIIGVALLVLAALGIWLSNRTKEGKIR